ncbi:hypothetical protein [Parasitella parasitica]|uniref:PH domain-containing protein n=1 Tax=Parasitella parasitica TaxID=35722 RepID=A0A0B7NPH7_9FUNG|nr:hypothetical protein [Parasitella parasitica]
MLKQLRSPIIIVQDSSYGNISTTTNDILNQVELLRYSSNLKGVDLDQFMQMTDEEDFKLFGIRKQRDCQKLSKIAQSIRRSSLTSSLSSFSQQSEDDFNAFEVDANHSPIFNPTQETQNDEIPYYALNKNEDSMDDTNIVEEVLQKIRSISAKPSNIHNKEEQSWPNSIREPVQKRIWFAADPPKCDNSRRSSLSSLNFPAYCDYIMDKRRRNSYANDNSDLPKRSMEDGEVLPGYSCSVQKMGKASAKIEFDFPGVRPKRRPWRDIYMELNGTILKIYEAKNTSPSLGGYRYLPTMAPYYQQSSSYTPLTNLSLSNAKVQAATDYTKKQNVFRIITENGPQILFHVQTSAALLLWTEKISAGINIAVDLEYRHMPKFNTTVAFEDSNNNNSSSATHRSYRACAQEERQRRDLRSDDILL